MVWCSPRARADHRGLFRDWFGAAGPCDPGLAHRRDQSRLHFPPGVSRLGDRRLAGDLLRHLVRDREERIGAVARATEDPALVQAFGISVPRLVMLTYGAGALAARRRDGGADLPGGPLMGSEPDCRGVRRGGDRRHGSILGAIVAGFALGLIEGSDQGVLPQASNTAIFVIMAVVLPIRPAGLFGRSTGLQAQFLAEGMHTARTALSVPLGYALPALAMRRRSSIRCS